MPNERTQPAPVVTLGRATEFFNLLGDLGHGDVLDQIATARHAELPTGRPVSAAEQAGMVEPEQEQESLAVVIDLGKIFQAVRDGALMRCASIIMDVTEEEAADVDDESFMAAWFFFVPRSLELYGKLVTSVNDLG